MLKVPVSEGQYSLVVNCLFVYRGFRAHRQRWSFRAIMVNIMPTVIVNYGQDIFAYLSGFSLFSTLYVINGAELLISHPLHESNPTSLRSSFEFKYILL